MILQAGASLKEDFIKTKEKYCSLNTFVFLPSLFLLLLLISAGCKNPFAPALDTSEDSDGSTLSDLTTIDGVFQNFKYAYTFKDTTIYGEFIAQDFTFTYLDPEEGFTVAWGRDEEMRATNGLFQNSQKLDVIWNNIISITQDTLSAELIRSFNLTVTFNPTDVIRLNGRARFLLRKNPDTGKWAIVVWDDKLNF